MRTALLAATALLLTTGPALAADPVQVGRVTAVSGTATARQPGQSARTLACGDPILAGDTVETTDGSLVGFLSDAVQTHLDGNGRLRVDQTPDRQLDTTLEQGSVRMLDARDDGPPARLAVLDARAELVGTDTEGYLFSEKVGPYAMLCEWDAPLPVSRLDQRRVATPGECVIAKPTEPLYLARAHDARLPLLVAEVCDLTPEIARLTATPLNHLSPADVSAGPPVGPNTQSAGLGIGAPVTSALPPITGCDSPGVCAAPPPPLAVGGGAVGGAAGF